MSSKQRTVQYDQKRMTAALSRLEAAEIKYSKPYDSRLTLTADKPGNYMSYGKPVLQKGKPKPLMFAAIISKSYAAFHLFPVHMFPDLVKNISLELKKGIQGKTCWNFTSGDENLFAELARVVEAGFRRFETAGYI